MVASSIGLELRHVFYETFYLGYKYISSEQEKCFRINRKPSLAVFLFSLRGRYATAMVAMTTRALDKQFGIRIVPGGSRETPLVREIGLEFVR